MNNCNYIYCTLVHLSRIRSFRLGQIGRLSAVQVQPSICVLTKFTQVHNVSENWPKEAVLKPLLAVARGSARLRLEFTRGFKTAFKRLLFKGMRIFLLTFNLLVYYI